MKILITTPTYPPYNSGLGNVVQTQAKLISSLGHDVIVATSGKTNDIRVDKSANAQVVEFEISGAEYIARPIKGEKDKYIKFLLFGNFDVVILNGWQNWATDLALNLLDNLTSKVYVYSHCISTNTIYKADLLRSFVRYILLRPYWLSLPQRINKLNGVIFLSDNGCDSRFDDFRLSNKLKTKKWIIPNAIPTYAENILRSSNNPLEKRSQIISVGSYDWFKGHDFVMRSYANSIVKNKIVIKIFGQKYSTHTDNLRSLADRLGISDEFIQFNQGLSSTALMKEYCNSILLLNGSHSECQPLVILDAMAAGVPFISRKSGSIPNLKGGVCVDNHREAACSINNLTNNPSKWSQLSNLGRSHIYKYHSQSVIKEKIEVFLSDIIH